MIRSRSLANGIGADTTSRRSITSVDTVGLDRLPYSGNSGRVWSELRCVDLVYPECLAACPSRGYLPARGHLGSQMPSKPRNPSGRFGCHMYVASEETPSRVRSPASERAGLLRRSPANVYAGQPFHLLQQIWCKPAPTYILKASSSALFSVRRPNSHSLCLSNEH